MNTKTNYKIFWNWQSAGLAAVLLGVVVVPPVPAETSDFKSPTTDQTAIANMTNADMRMEVLPVTSVGASDTNAEFAVLRAKAENGDAQSQFELGQVFYSGEFGGATNYAEAVKWFRKAAGQNLPAAQYNLGVCYERGAGVVRDCAEAVMWYRKAAEQNYAEAQHNLGVCYRDGQGVAKNEMEAVKWFRKAAEQDFTMACYNLGACYDYGLGVTQDFKEAVKWYRKAAEQNFAQAQHNLGECYRTGHGVAEDAVEAVKWFRKAAEQNLARAQHNLGVCYERGDGVAKDYVEAVKWYRKAAEQNDPRAQYNLGICYGEGQGVAQNYMEAYKWLLLAGAQGVEVARQDMAELERQLTPDQRVEGQKRASDFKPQEVTADPSFQDPQGGTYGNAPADLLAKAEAGDAKAQNELGEAFYAGRLDVRRDPVAAVKWFRKAAEQNLAAAQSNLGVCYERGDGVAKYEVEAYKWDLLAAAQGDAKAKSNTTLLELLMSQEQIEEGKQRAQVWFKQLKTNSPSHASEVISSSPKSKQPN
jgi:TPR repeat protein